LPAAVTGRSPIAGVLAVGCHQFINRQSKIFAETAAALPPSQGTFECGHVRQHGRHDRARFASAVWLSSLSQFHPGPFG
jgi:hypothetical protein